MSTYKPISYTATAGQTDFTISFPYLAQAHIQVYVNNALKELTTDYTIDSGTTLRFNLGLSAGDVVYIRRQTNLGTDALEVTLGVGARLDAEDLNDSFKQIAYPAQEFLAEAQSEVVKTDSNLSDLSSVSNARTNLGLELKSTTDSKLATLITEGSNLGNLTDFAAARTNLDAYSLGEVRTQIDTAKDNSFIPTEGAPFCTSLEYSPIIMNCRLLLDSIDNKKIVLTSFNGNYLWCNGSLRLFYVTSLTTSGLSNSTLYYVYLRCDEDGGYYIYTSTSAPTTYRNIQVQIVSGEYRPLVGYLYTAANYSTNGILDVSSVYNRYGRSKTIMFNPQSPTGTAGELAVVRDIQADDYIIAQQGSTVKVSLLFSHMISYGESGTETVDGVSQWTNFLDIHSKNSLFGGAVQSSVQPAYSIFLGQGRHLVTTSIEATSLDVVACKWYVRLPAQVAIYDAPYGTTEWSSTVTYNTLDRVSYGERYYYAQYPNVGDKPPSDAWYELDPEFQEYKDPTLDISGYMGRTNAYLLLSVQ